MTFDDTPTYRETISSNDPDEIREEIERTRGDLSRNVNALGEAVRPSNVARRQASRVAGAATDLKDRVMGSAEDLRDTAMDSASSVSDTASQMGSTVTDAATSRTRGNPLAVGLIALGAGWLVGSLLPATQPEQRLAEKAKEQAQPLVGHAQQAAKESAENLKEPVKQAAQEVKASAQDAAASVKDETVEAGQEVRSSASASSGTSGSTSGSKP
jgi:gas vesicle protein